MEYISNKKKKTALIKNIKKIIQMKQLDIDVQNLIENKRITDSNTYFQIAFQIRIFMGLVSIL